MNASNATSQGLLSCQNYRNRQGSAGKRYAYKQHKTKAFRLVHTRCTCLGPQQNLCYNYLSVLELQSSDTGIHVQATAMPLRGECIGASTALWSCQQSSPASCKWLSALPSAMTQPSAMPQVYESFCSPTSTKASQLWLIIVHTLRRSQNKC